MGWGLFFQFSSRLPKFWAHFYFMCPQSLYVSNLTLCVPSSLYVSHPHFMCPILTLCVPSFFRLFSLYVSHRICHFGFMRIISFSFQSYGQGNIRSAKKFSDRNIPGDIPWIRFLIISLKFVFCRKITSGCREQNIESDVHIPNFSPAHFGSKKHIRNQFQEFCQAVCPKNRKFTDFCRFFFTHLEFFLRDG